MNARERLDDIKAQWGLRTDEDLAKKLEIPKETINTWIKRKAIPPKWELKLVQIAPSSTQTPHPQNQKATEMIEAWQTLPVERQDMYYHKIKGEALEHATMSNPLGGSISAFGDLGQKSS